MLIINGYNLLIQLYIGIIMLNESGELQFNPYIHGTSSETLSLMKHTGFQIMPILCMMQDFKIAPMVGELRQGGFASLGEGPNNNTIVGAPSFGRVHDLHYDLNKVIKNYATQSQDEALTASQSQQYFKSYVTSSQSSAFSSLSLLMINLVRLRQLGVDVSNVITPDEINTFIERLDAAVQFYYFIACIEKHIFIDTQEMSRFKSDNKLSGDYAVGDYLKHYFSFENLIENIRKNKLNIEHIYNNPTPENINDLLDVMTIRNGSTETVERYWAKADKFIAKSDYHFFSSKETKTACEIRANEIGGYLFTNTSGYRLEDYLEQYYKNFRIDKGRSGIINLPSFKGFHDKVVTYIDALKDRSQLCKTLLAGAANEFIAYDNSDELNVNPFPVVFVTKAKSIEKFQNEFRSKVPLKLGKEIFLVVTNDLKNQKKIRDYCQINKVGPVEVLLFNDLHTMCSGVDEKHFNELVNDDWIKAFELADKNNCADQLSTLYRLLSELNEKRYRFKSTDLMVNKKLNDLFDKVQENILTQDRKNINFKGLKNILALNKADNYTLYATHRGLLGVMDTLLTVIVSLVIFYPITYLIQNSINSRHTFFATDTEKKIDRSLLAIEKIINDPSFNK